MKNPKLYTQIKQVDKFNRVRLILGDQLNPMHSWYKEVDSQTLYVIAELPQETDYVKHHIQKLCAFFAAMGNFAQSLSKAKHSVLYLNLDESSKFKNLIALLEEVMSRTQAQHFEFQRPDEYRLQNQLKKSNFKSKYKVDCVDTEHFLLSHEDINHYFSGGKTHRMESFYRSLRKKYNILMASESEPEGGQWNFDKENRNKLKKKDIEEIPEPLVFKNNTQDILKRIKSHSISYFGKEEEPLPWPVTVDQSRELLEFFIENALPNFGKFQDAMTCESPHAWSLYHSRLSFSLNTKMLHPKQVIKAAINAHRKNPEKTSLAQVEGFVRQIMGWREFVRGIYWSNMPQYKKANHLKAKRELPEYFWSGKTKMRCMSASLGQSLDTAYAHHIQRLMVIGNFCLITELDPDQVDDWYLGVYIDAIEWVELPNVRGMSLYADGGVFASKPYAASGNYINKMSDYCRHCEYKIKETSGKHACPFNSLYWRFMVRNKDQFGSNPRINMLFSTWEKKSEEEKKDILDTAKNNLIRIKEL